MINGKRFARVEGGAKHLETIRSYLPKNYTADILWTADYPPSKNVLIQGTDDHGWTLDGYVIPRLASGLIVAKEI